MTTQPDPHALQLILFSLLNSRLQYSTTPFRRAAAPMIDFSQLDRVIHEKGRLSIMTLLAARGPWSFQDLKGELEMSDGNLITHLRTLAKEGYVSEVKTTALDSERPRTNYEITAAGRTAFKGYIKILEAIVKHSKPH